MQICYWKTKVPNNWKCRSSTSCQFTLRKLLALLDAKSKRQSTMPSTLLVKTVVAVDCCMFACIGNDLQLLAKAVGLIYAPLAAPFSVLFSPGGGGLSIGARRVTRS